MASTVIKGDIVDYLEKTDKNAFITGRAGSGKSVQLKRYIKRNRHQVLTVAPTGIAAIGCKGTTIHRTFQLPIKPIVDDEKEIQNCVYKVGKELKQCNVILVDEIGMVRADTWEVIDKIMRLVKRNDAPFGGVRIIAFGDLYQLPPIVSRNEMQYFVDKYGTDRGYFFCTPVMKDFPFQMIELTKVFRQKDDRFIEILNSVRVGQITDEQLALLNSRFRPDFKAAEGFVTLCPRNATADRINSERLKSLPGKPKRYYAECDESFPKSMKPNDDVVTLKEGCQVMAIKNVYSEDGKMIANGQIGVVEELHEYSVSVSFDGKTAVIAPEEWESHSPVVVDGKLSSKCAGVFTQIPLKVAYACTIHKSQGVTLEKCIIDMEGGAFADGQTYVALSRCRSLDGIVLKCKLSKSDIRTDSTLVDYMVQSQMDGRYIEFIQDEIEGLFGADKKYRPIEIIRDGARNGEWVTEEEMTAINDLLSGEDVQEALEASKAVLPRMIDEMRCLRTEVADLRNSMELVDA